MKIRQGSTPSGIGRVGLGVSRASPRGVRAGRVILPAPPPIPHLPPVHFFAESDVAAGAEVGLRSEALMNRTGRPVEIHEIRLAARIPTNELFSRIDVGSFIRVRLNVLGKPITNGFIPIWLLGKTESRASQVASGTEANAMYVCRLARPWYISDKTPITAEFQHTGAVRFAARAQIGLAGKYVQNRASTSFVPFISSFISRPFQYEEVGFDESSEKDLVNTTGRVLAVDRIISRINTTHTTLGSIGFVSDEPNDAGPVSLVTTRVLLSSNLPVIRDFASNQAVYGFSRSIDIPHTIAPNDFFRVSVRKIAGPTITTPFTTWTAQANVSIVGSREEAI